jgi:hypothetical protein
VQLFAPLAVVGVPIGMMVGPVGLQHFEQQALGCPARDNETETPRTYSSRPFDLR